MRYSLLGLALFPVLAMAQPLPDNFNQEKFEKRFIAADKDGNGALSRTEAYAEFPRMPEFFDEIDKNKDQKITLVEVNQAIAQRVTAAMNASSPGSKYVKPEYIKPRTTTTAQDPEMENLFSSHEEAHRHEFYETFAEDQSNTRKRGIPVPAKAPPNLLNKTF